LPYFLALLICQFLRRLAGYGILGWLTLILFRGKYENMKLTLALAIDCSLTECKARLLEDGAVILTGYSVPVLARLPTMPGQLVAVDLNPDKPEIVYRWLPGTIREFRGAKIIIDDQHASLIEAVRAPGLEASLKIDDWVYVSFGYAKRWEIADLASDGYPAHPAYLRQYAFPKIEALYQQKASNA
jgi:hypothetical protein